MKYETFFSAGWNSKIIENLRSYHCGGIELSKKDLDELGAKKEALSIIISDAKNILLSPQFFVFTGHEVFQPTSRVVKHKKLWGSVATSTPILVSEAVEWSVFSSAGMKFFGIVSKDVVSDDDLLYLWRTLKTTWLVIFNNGLDVRAIPQRLPLGWTSKSFGFPSALLDLASDGNAILVTDFGSAADRQNGLIAIAKEDLLDKFLAFSAGRA